MVGRVLQEHGRDTEWWSMPVNMDVLESLCMPLCVELESLFYPVDTPCLWMVETVHKRKTAKTLNDGWGLTSPGEDSSRNKLKVLIQVNTSKEKGKFWPHLFSWPTLLVVFFYDMCL